MWPQALQMTREECRGVLRRLELESYSHVISVFRAQGGLNDAKAKLLEELRGIFHISQERHRVEARRVANDEQLATIAEAISGPNTWQEWSREGRRSFPLLPRVAPQTALALIANNAAMETAIENAKLPYPADTAEAFFTEEQKNCAAKTDIERKFASNVVKNDPFKMPEIPVVIAKRNLKRNLTDSGQSGGANKKRISNDTSPIKLQQQQTKFQMKPPYQHITASTSAPQNAAGQNNTKKVHQNNKFKNSQPPSQKSQKAVAKKLAVLQQNATTAEQQKLNLTATNNVSAITMPKRQATPAKCGRRAQKLQQRKQPQLKLQMQQSLDQQSSSDAQYSPQIDYEEPQMVVMDIPQIPVSTKDISKTLTKLQKQNTPNTPTVGVSNPVATLAASPGLLGTVIPPKALSNSKALSDKSVRSTTLQKYIVEDRHQMSSSPQILTLPQLTSATSPLRSALVNAPTTGKMSTKNHMVQTLQVPATCNASMIEPMVIDDISDGKMVTEEHTTVKTQLSSISATAIHAPPAILQLPSDSIGTQLLDVSTPSPTITKVLTRKLMPIVLSSTQNLSAIGGSNSNNLVNLTKLETLNNGATIIGTGANPTITGSTIIKNISTPTLLIAGGQAAGGGITSNVASSVSSNAATSGLNTITTPTIITSGTVFRKPPSNIIKTGIIGMGSGNILSSSSVGTKAVFTTSSSNSGPQIISNIKLTSATSPPIVAATTQQQQQFLKNVPSAGLRTPVKICQSPNGKVFIQPANKLPTVTPNKFLTGNASISAVANAAIRSSISGTQHQRIAIQKVQIIPAPGSSNVLTAQPKPSSIAISSGNIGNTSGQKFIMPVTRPHTTGTITLTKSGSLFTSVMTKVQQQHQQLHPQLVLQQQTAKDVSKSNVVVIGATTLQTQSLHTTTSSKEMSDLDDITSLKSSPMITEDTPVDILSTPITLSGTVFTLKDNKSNTNVPSNHDYNKQEQSQQVIGVTDWEMELDQATAASKTCNQHHNLIRVENTLSEEDISDLPVTSNILNTTTTTTSIPTTIVDNATVFLDDCFEDVIVEEHEGDDLHVDGQKDIDDDENIYSHKEAESEQLPTQVKHLDKTQQSLCEIGLKETELPCKLTSGEFDNADAGFDETIADYTETDDENTAVEYIEGDQSEDPTIAPCTELSQDQQSSDANKMLISNLSNAQIYNSSCNEIISLSNEKNLQNCKTIDTNTVSMEEAMKNISVMTIQNDVNMSIECNSHADNIDKTNNESVNNVILPVSMTVAVAAQNQL